MNQGMNIYKLLQVLTNLDLKECSEQQLDVLKRTFDRSKQQVEEEMSLRGYKEESPSPTTGKAYWQGMTDYMRKHLKISIGHKPTFCSTEALRVKLKLDEEVISEDDVILN